MTGEHTQTGERQISTSAHKVFVARNAQSNHIRKYLQHTLELDLRTHQQQHQPRRNQK